MAVFEDVYLQWGDQEYKVPSNQIMKLIANIDDVIKVNELIGDNPSVPRIAEAYSIALNAAGARISTEEVYDSMFDAQAETIKGAILGLLTLMIPPKRFRTIEANGQAITEEKK